MSAAIVDYEPIVPEAWMDGASCPSVDTDMFFPEKGGTTRPAKLVCGGCEVRAECLQYALTHQERFGVWGGLSERERRRLSGPGIPQRRIVRPAKCGTSAAYQAHYRRGEKPCQYCRDAEKLVRSLRRRSA
jgi:WhiB family redox-sensing transcriptional regulator